MLLKCLNLTKQFNTVLFTTILVNCANNSLILLFASRLQVLLAHSVMCSCTTIYPLIAATWLTSAYQNNFQPKGNPCSNLQRKGRSSCSNMTQKEQNNWSQIHPDSMCHDQHFGKVLWNSNVHKTCGSPNKLSWNSTYMEEVIFFQYIVKMGKEEHKILYFWDCASPLFSDYPWIIAPPLEGLSEINTALI